MLDEKLKEQIKKKFSSELKGNVKLLLFGEGDDCTYCLEYRKLVEELASLSDKLSFESFPFSANVHEQYGVDTAPSLVVYSENHKTSAIFCGPPGSHFFVVLLEDIVDASRGSPNLPKDLVEKVKAIDFPVKIIVFGSQSCPYCPPAVKAAHDFSLINPNIKAQMVDGALFPGLRQKYRVMGVPKTIINNKIEFTGARPPSELLEQILRLKH